MRRRQPVKVVRRHLDDLTPAEMEMELVERGWIPSSVKGQWQHPNLASIWPAHDALKLQDEADNGMQDPVHRDLRGDAT